jgi:hypothetical protein
MEKMGTFPIDPVRESRKISMGVPGTHAPGRSWYLHEIAHFLRGVA